MLDVATIVLIGHVNGSGARLSFTFEFVIFYRKGLEDHKRRIKFCKAGYIQRLELRYCYWSIVGHVNSDSEIFIL